MHSTIQALKNALAYAKFNDSELKEATEKLVEEIGKDLDEELYEPSPDTVTAESELNSAMNNLDESVEGINATIQRVKDEDDDLRSLDEEDEDDDESSTKGT